MTSRSSHQQRERVGRVLVAKLGLDGHDVGAKVVARLLRDQGFEVIYLGIRQTPDAVAHAAVVEDVDLVGLSMLSGSHIELTGRVLSRLKRGDELAPPVVVGGVIPPDDEEALRQMGVRAVFTAGTPVADMLKEIRALVSEYRQADR